MSPTSCVPGSSGASGAPDSDPEAAQSWGTGRLSHARNIVGRCRERLALLPLLIGRSSTLAVVDQVIYSGTNVMSTILVGRFCGSSCLGLFALSICLCVAQISLIYWLLAFLIHSAATFAGFLTTLILAVPLIFLYQVTGGALAMLLGNAVESIVLCYAFGHYCNTRS